jgi:hypothetical protein
LRLRLYGYNDHDNFDHDYITCVHATPAVTTEGKRGETGKAPEVPTH